jgi:hypothetical protein
MTAQGVVKRQPARQQPLANIAMTLLVIVPMSACCSLVLTGDAGAEPWVASVNRQLRIVVVHCRNGANMNTLNQPKNSPSSSGAIHFGTKASKRVRDSSYAALLQDPLKTLACNVADRPDISTVAILGYN